jgi:hypothetical protein
MAKQHGERESTPATPSPSAAHSDRRAGGGADVGAATFS